MVRPQDRVRAAWHARHADDRSRAAGQHGVPLLVANVLLLRAGGSFSRKDAAPRICAAG